MTLKYKLLMGGVDDFDGANHEDTHAFVHNEYRWVTFTNNPKTINKDLFTLVAHREPIASEQDLNDCIGAPEADNKYLHEIKPGIFVDVYDVLMAWNVSNPALQHLIKKALQPGERGHKSREQDLQDIIDSAIRAKELEIK